MVQEIADLDEQCNRTKRNEREMQSIELFEEMYIWAPPDRGSHFS
jgi:hypothetical protein